MTIEIIVVLGLVAIAIILFATEVFAIDLVALIIMATLLGSGIISPKEGLSGVSRDQLYRIAGAMKGLSLNEVDHLQNRLFNIQQLGSILLINTHNISLKQ